MLYGAQYYRPPFPDKTCWRRDLEQMKKSGFNCVKLWAVWNWVEKTPGTFDFSQLDELVGLAGKSGLQVVINTIPEGTPYWVYDEFGMEDLYHTAKNMPVVSGGPANIPSAGWPGLCMDCAEYAALVARFIERTAAHYREEKTVIALDVWNEPHLEPMYDYREELLCYCRHSQKAFLMWLKEKYGTLEALNTAWFRTYTDWGQVKPPVRFGTWTDMNDWRRFWLENLQRWMRIRVAAAKKGAPKLVVQSHVAYSGILGNKIQGGLANELGDEFLLARETDWFGLSSFPRWLMGKEHLFRHLQHNEMVAQACRGKMFYQVELQGGGGKPGLLGGEVPDVRDVRLWNWNTVAAGGKGTVYWQYAPEPAGVESPGFGLTGFGGEETERSRAAAQIADRLLHEMPEEAVPVRAVNAVYVSRETDILAFSAGRKEELYAASISGIYKAAYMAGIPIGFFHQDDLEKLSGSGIQTLFLPMPLVLSEEEKRVLRVFAEQGGTLVAEAAPGLYGTDGLLDCGQKFLREVFGIVHGEIQAAEEWGEIKAFFTEEQGTFTGRLYRQAAVVQEEVRVCAVFEDGKPAVTEKRLGKGRTVWIGTFAGYHYEHAMEPGTGRLLRKWMNPAGYVQIGELYAGLLPGEGEGASEKDIPLAPVVRLLETPGEYVLVIVNHGLREAEIKVRCKNEGRRFIIPASEGKIVRWKRGS